MKKGLGKGLGALLEITEEDKKEVAEMDIDLVERDANQPRKTFDEGEIDALAESISQKGILQPLIVRKNGNIFTIVAGERRWRAAKSLKLKTVPVIVKELTDREILEISLIENVQRKDLNCIEEAAAYRRLADEYTMKQEEIAKSIGKSRSAVTNKMRLLELEVEIKNLLSESKISEGHGRALLAIEDRKIRKEMVQKILDEELSVREIEKLATQTKKEIKKKEIHLEYEEEFKHVENALAKKFGTKVNITRNAKKGKITIHYYSMEGLNRILDTMKRK